MRSGGGKDKFLIAWDERVSAWCAYCGGTPSTKDHVPSRVLLDRPYDAGSPFVGACYGCNNGLSEAETYVACLIDCALAGTSDPEGVTRLKVRQALKRNSKLAARLATARFESAGRTYFSVDDTSVRRVLLKLARGHSLFELNETCKAEPTYFGYCALETLSEDLRYQFESLPTSSLWPEVVSRGMQRLLIIGDQLQPDWVIVQPGRYRYGTSWDTGRIVVRIVLSEYLACETIWIDAMPEGGGTHL